ARLASAPRQVRAVHAMEHQHFRDGVQRELCFAEPDEPLGRIGKPEILAKQTDAVEYRTTREQCSAGVARDGLRAGMLTTGVFFRRQFRRPKHLSMRDTG